MVHSRRYRLHLWHLKMCLNRIELIALRFIFAIEEVLVLFVERRQGEGPRAALDAYSIRWPSDFY